MKIQAKVAEKYATIPSDDVIQKTADALTANGMKTYIVDTKEEAKKKFFELVPEGAEIMNNTSVTLDAISISDEILNSGKYKPTRATLVDPNASPKEKKIAAATSDYTAGSVHAITQDGTLMIASNTGSQLPSEAYGSAHVIFVAGAQKIVTDRDEGFDRIYKHTLPLESVRANKAYNITSGSFVSKLLIINREITPDRIHVIIVKEVLGF
jgi:hypothetical protein